MRVFISGGCKNGKSSFAQKLAKNQAKNGKLYYIATMIPSDSEDDERIERHKQEREGWGFITVEQPKNIEEILKKCDKNGTFLLDSLTALLANEMFSKNGDFDEKASERVKIGLAKVLGKLKNIIVVSDFIYSDAIVYDPLTESYRKSLAALDRLSAKICDVVIEASYSQIMVHKSSNENETFKIASILQGGKIHPKRLARSALAEGVSSLRNQNTLAEGVSSLRNHCHEGVL